MHCALWEQKYGDYNKNIANDKIHLKKPVGYNKMNLECYITQNLCTQSSNGNQPIKKRRERERERGGKNNQTVVTGN